MRLLRVPVRLLRVLRLFKLLRLLRASRLFRRWETRISINYGLLTMMRCVAYVLLCLHWMACAWTLQTTLFALASPLDSWMGAYGYCYDATALPSQAPSTAHEAVHCVRPVELYLASLYWSTLVTTGLGGGDLDSSVFSASERAWSVLLVLLGSLVWANVVATLCGVINQV